MAEEKSIDPRVAVARLSSTAGVLKSRIAMIEDSICFRKSLRLQALAKEKRELLARVEGELEALRKGVKPRLREARPFGAERKRRKRMKQLRSGVQ